MGHTYDAKAFGAGSKGAGDHHVVHQQADVTVAGYKEERHAKEDAAARTNKAKELGSSAVYEVRPAADGMAVVAEG